MKNFIETDHSCSDEKFETCTGKGRCVQIKKTRNSIIWLGVAIVVLAYFLLIPDANQIKELSKKVSPAASLYSNPKSLQGKFPLINDQLQTTTLSEVGKNRWIALYFGYTSCPDVCPTDLATLNQTLGLMKHADKLQVVFISVDPKRDIGNLDTFTKKFNDNFIGLSADNDVLRSMTKTLGVYHKVKKTQQKALAENHNKDMRTSTNNKHLINHAPSYLLLNPELKLTGLLTSPHHATKMAHALDLIIETLE